MSADAVRIDPDDHHPDLAAPMGEVPVARPGFGRSMTWLVLLSVPLWAALAGAGYLVVHLLA